MDIWSSRYDIFFARRWWGAVVTFPLISKPWLEMMGEGGGGTFWPEMISSPEMIKAGVIHRRCDDSPHVAVNVSDEHDVQSHMFRPTITDLQDKYCCSCYNIYLTQSKYKGNHKRGGAAKHSPCNIICGESPHRVTAKYGDTVTAPLVNKNKKLDFQQNRAKPNRPCFWSEIISTCRL